ncbi:MAG: hypothetical protein GX146_06505 [Myxococcales bacterium]|jgi:hypothetical protein|nr:hypothetical protein [Myxococcales bacterium]
MRRWASQQQKILSAVAALLMLCSALGATSHIGTALCDALTHRRSIHELNSRPLLATPPRVAESQSFRSGETPLAGSALCISILFAVLGALLALSRAAQRAGHIHGRQTAPHRCFHLVSWLPRGPPASPSSAS